MKLAFGATICVLCKRDISLKKQEERRRKKNVLSTSEAARVSAMTITTETGSVYRLDRDKMTWERQQIPRIDDKNFPLRTVSGKLHEWPDVELSQPLVMMGPPIDSKADYRIVRTSLVRKIIYEYYPFAHSGNVEVRPND
jgi:hypothetical protein